MFLYKVVHKVVTRLFTRLLQGCLQLRLLQGCYKVVTRLLQGCYKVFTHTCNQVVTRLLHNLVATLLQGCYNLVFSVWDLLFPVLKFQDHATQSGEKQDKSRRTEN